MPHSSFFNYNVQKPYPYKWFTPVALTAFIILTVLLSVMNFVQNSYVLTVQYVDNPNATTTTGVWYRYWPSYLTNGVRPTCEPANLPVNTQFFTNQSGLMWTVTNIFKGDDKSQALPSLPYLNNVLDDCNVSEIRLEYDSTQDLDVSVLQNSAWALEIRAFVTCGVSGPTGNTLMNLTAVYNALTPYATPGVTDFIAKNTSSRASMYWSEVLLRAYWIHAIYKIFTVSNNLYQGNIAGLAKGVVTLYPKNIKGSILNDAFFDMQYDFLEKHEGYGYTGQLNSMAYYMDQTNNSAIPHIWDSVDSLAKSMYSAALADLGQAQLPSELSLVTNATTIQHFTSDFGAPWVWSMLGGIPVELETQSYDARQRGPNPTGPLGLSPSVVATKYLCQVPRLKPIGDIFVSVLIADIVFLQAAWKLYTLLVDKLFLRRRANAMYCEGCLENENAASTVVVEEQSPRQKPLKNGIVSSAVSVVNGAEREPRIVRTRIN